MKFFCSVSNPYSILFHVAGFACLIWFLTRTVPKPDRIYYPCQQLSMTVASSYIIFWTILWSALFHGVAFWVRRAKTKTTAILPVILVSFIVIFSISSGVFANIEKNDDIEVSSWNPIPNEPIGTAQGVNPGRVVWVWDPDATETNLDGYWWEKQNNNQEVLDEMFTGGIQELADVEETSDAWDSIFRHFNLNHDKGDIGYQPGEKIAIKLNFNNCYKFISYFTKDNDRDANPYVVKSLLRHLINVVGVEQEDITIYDASRVIPNNFYRRVYYETYPALLLIPEFPNIHYADTSGLTLGREKVQASSEKIYFAHDSDVVRTLPTCVVDADYIINMPLLKRHPINNGVTLSGKNLFGTWMELVLDIHPYHKDGLIVGNPAPQTDLLAHEHIGGKTLLYIGDGTFATKIDHKTIGKFEMYPFNNDWTNSLFFSQDPVAIDSVMYDFLHTEGTNPIEGSQNYMHESAVPTPNHYDPENDGEYLSESLGVHEHWNESADIFSSDRYSGPGNNGIDFVAIIGGEAEPSIDITTPRTGYIYLSGEQLFRFLATVIIGDINIVAEISGLTEEVDKVEFYIDDQLITTDDNEPYGWTWSGGPTLKHTLKAVAYYNETVTLEDNMIVWKFG